MRSTCIALLLLAVVLPAQGSGPASRPAPIVFTLRVDDPESHGAQVEAVVPTDGRATVEVRMAVWSPGFYRVENHARRVQGLTAWTQDGKPLSVDQPKDNRWRVAVAGGNAVVLRYTLLCKGQSVTTNWVGPGYAVFNGPATFVTLVEDGRRPHEVHLQLPAAWTDSATALLPAPDQQAHHYLASDFDLLADSPIVAGTLQVQEFEVAGSKHRLVEFGALAGWDAPLAAQRLAAIAAEHGRFLGGLPFDHYVFLDAHRPGGGGLEHSFSTLLTTGPGATPEGGWLSFVSHEYFHAINVKRLRPIELGPFDYESPPRTAGLWIAEGLTTYYGDLAVVRSGVGSEAEFLRQLSGLIRQLQGAPGRLVQTLEQASLDVWSQSTSGVGGDARKTVSYYIKGPVVGWLLDARLRRLTEGRRSLDDLMRLAFVRWSGERGFRRDEFEAAAGEVAGSDLHEFFASALRSTQELDYREALEWFGLRFAETRDKVRPWTLEVHPEATQAQKQHRERWLAATPAR